MMGLAVQTGLPAEKLVDLSEDKPRARTLVERLFANFASPLSDPGVWAASAEADTKEQLLGGVLFGGISVFAGQRLILRPDPPLGEPVLLEKVLPEALLAAQPAG